MSTFGERLKQARKAAKLTQRELAQRLSTDVMNISRWERGEVKRPSGENLAALADALGVSSDFLLLGREPAPRRSGPPPKHWAEFLRRYEHIDDFTEDQLDALQTFYDRQGKAPRSWTDWERLANIVRTSEPSEHFEAARKRPKE